MTTRTARRTHDRHHGSPLGDLSDLTNLDASGIPCLGEVLGRPGLADLPIPGLQSGAVMATVQRVQQPRPQRPLAWGTTSCGKVVFDLDSRTAAELRSALDAGEEPTVIVEPSQILAVDIEVVR